MSDFRFCLVSHEDFHDGELPPEAWQIHIRSGSVCTDTWARSPTSEVQWRPMFSSHQQMYKGGNGQTRWGWAHWVPGQEVMAKTSVTTSVCYWNSAGETAKKKRKERGEKFGWEVFRHYISDNLRVPSVTGAANCFHRESRGNNVLQNERLFELPVEIHT